MSAFVRVRLLLRLTRSGLPLLRRSRMNPVGRLVDVQLAGNLIGGRFELLDTFAQTAGNLRDPFGSKNQEDGQEYEY